MDIKEYISSCILENYVLGSTSPQERQEVECMSHIYPEIKEELTKLQEAIENFATASAVQPPASLKMKIMDQIDLASQEETKTSQPTMTVVKDTSEKKVSTVYKISIAASIIVLLGISSILLNTNQKVEQLNAEVQVLSSDKDFLASEISKLNAENTLLSDTATVSVLLAGTAKNPNATVTVYWNKNAEKAIMKVNNLPTHPTDKQYQLWAIVDGKPTDMGVFDLAQENLKSIDFKPKNIQAFAITLEPLGGSIAPTLSDLVVIGYI